MDTEQKLYKTPKGIEEIRDKKYKLSPRLRSVLILIDGSKSLSALMEQAGKLGVSVEAVMGLEKEGFITQAEPSQQQVVQQNAQQGVQQTIQQATEQPAQATRVSLFSTEVTSKETPVVNPVPEKGSSFAGAVRSTFAVVSEQEKQAMQATQVPMSSAMSSPSPEVIEATRSFIREYLLKVLGEDAQAFLSEVEQAKTKQDLLEQAQKCRSLIRSFEGSEKADTLWEMVQGLLK